MEDKKREKIISERKIKRLTSLEGEVKGMGMKTHADFILEKEGTKGLRKLEKAMADSGHPVDYTKLKRMEFYPMGLEALTLELIKIIFNYSEEKFQQMGEFHCKTSWIVKFFMKYFFSFDRMAKEVPKIWKKYFTVGELKLIDYDERKGYALLRVENFYFHPLHCQIMIGILSAVIQMMVNNRVSCKETKCPYEGDDYHEYLLKWNTGAK